MYPLAVRNSGSIVPCSTDTTLRPVSDPVVELLACASVLPLKRCKLTPLTDTAVYRQPAGSEIQPHLEKAVSAKNRRVFVPLRGGSSRHARIAKFEPDLSFNP